MIPKLSDKELKVLLHIEHEDGDATPPEGMSIAGYATACDKLKEKGFARVAFVEGHEVEAVSILPAGMSYLEDWREEESRAQQISKADSDKLFWEYLTANDGERFHRLVEKVGLPQSMFATAEDIENLFAEDNVEAFVSANPAIKGEESVPRHSSFQIAGGHKTDFIKVLYAMAKQGFFMRSDGRISTVSEVMNGFGSILDDKTICNYSSYMSTSKKNSSSDKAFYQIMLDLGKVLKIYYTENNKKC